MDYAGLTGLVNESAWQPLSNKLVDAILTTKNNEKMPGDLARHMLHLWQQDSLASKMGLAVLLEAAVKLEPEKTLSILSELQLRELETKIREGSKL
jgi:hypothetical protein